MEVYPFAPDFGREVSADPDPDDSPANSSTMVAANSSTLVAAGPRVLVPPPQGSPPAMVFHADLPGSAPPRNPNVIDQDIVATLCNEVRSTLKEAVRETLLSMEASLAKQVVEHITALSQSQNTIGVSEVSEIPLKQLGPRMRTCNTNTDSNTSSVRQDSVSLGGNTPRGIRKLLEPDVARPSSNPSLSQQRGPTCDTKDFESVVVASGTTNRSGSRLADMNHNRSSPGYGRTPTTLSTAMGAAPTARALGTEIACNLLEFQLAGSLAVALSVPERQSSSLPNSFFERCCRSLCCYSSRSSVSERAQSRPTPHGCHSVTMEDVRRRGVSEVVLRGQRSSPQVDSMVFLLAVPCPTLLKILGILPWRSNRGASVCYQWIWIVISIGTVALSVATVAQTRHSSIVGSRCYGSTCLSLGLFSDVPLALGSTLGLLACGAHDESNKLLRCLNFLSAHAMQGGFLDTAKKAMHLDLLVMIVIWLSSICARFYSIKAIDALTADDLSLAGVLEIALHMISFGIWSANLLGLALTVQNIAQILCGMVDFFCAECNQVRDLHKAIGEWNTHQALMRHTSDAIERLFFVLHTAGFCAVFLGVGDLAQHHKDAQSWVTLLPGSIIVIFGVARTFVMAALVTDRCAHVPSLVNALDFGEEFDVNRQLVVDYITNSAAGFYISESRLTSASALKAIYFCSVAVFTISSMILKS